MSRNKDPEKISNILPGLLGSDISRQEKVEKRVLQKPLKDQSKSKQLSEKTIRRKYSHLKELHDHIKDSEETYKRTDALRLARLVAITSLPTRRLKESKRSKVFRLGKKLWAKVTLAVEEGQELPFGEDRFVLAGIMHLAIENASPIVFFEHAGELLKKFEISRDRQGYKTLRERFKRLANLTIKIKYGMTKEEVEEENIGENMFVIRKYALPTRAEIESYKTGQLLIRGVLDNPELNVSPFGVRLSSEFWEYLSEITNQMVIPIALLKLFVDCPIGWDYALFLAARCYAAKTNSAIDHETLMTLFKEGKEPDRLTIKRLSKYHKQIMAATDNRLNAKLIQSGFFRSTGGRPKKKWKLVVGPSEKIVWSGKNPLITS